ncbi:unnamed protein product [Pieris macdunnoughi]|uniref:Reverse transcriptase domain-containing protein n=1 Tax=Pieris macdunnoughi TaxID=345717 RepID=A0A821X429_9NEOP|nr:unnamed protein product [Pieris macdunnoughi]
MSDDNKFCQAFADDVLVVVEGDSGEEVQRKANKIKILALTIDSKLTFNEHVSNICVKAANLSYQVAKAAEQTWGLDPDIVSTIYTAVVEPTITNAAAAWARATEKTCVPKKLNAIQRGFTQKIVKANRTVSLNAAFRNTST